MKTPKCLWCHRRMPKVRLFVDWCGDPCRDKWYARFDEKFLAIQRFEEIRKTRPAARGRDGKRRK